MKNFIAFLAVAIAMVILSGSASAQNVVYTDASVFPLYGKVSEQTNERYERLPSSLEGVSREPVWYLGRHSAGLFIRFRSNSTSIHARWESTFNNTMTHMTDTGTKGLDLYALVDGEWRHVCSAQPQGKKSERCIIANMDPVEREYMLYLSLYDGVKSLEIGVDEGSMLDLPAVNRPSREKPVVMYGTSILQGGCANRPGMAHTNIIGRRLDREVINLGFSGKSKLQKEFAELLADIHADAFVLDVFSNPQADVIYEKFDDFVDIIRTAHPDTPLIFLQTERRETRNFNHKSEERETAKQQAAVTVVRRRMQNDSNIYFIDSNDFLGDDHIATVDGTHPNDIGFSRMLDVIGPAIKNILAGYGVL